MLDATFFEKCAFVCVDIQEGSRGEHATDDKLPQDWIEMGFTADDVNAASDYAWDVALPNALRVVEACRAKGIPMIFIHWGYQLRDAMDLDPAIRRMRLRNHGEDPLKWDGHVTSPGARPYSGFNVRENEYVIAKTAQDSFISSNLVFVLSNLGVHKLILIGGHTEACLGKTATSARRLGFETLCVHDATNNARESSRMRGIKGAQFDHVVSTDDLLKLMG